MTAVFENWLPDRELTVVNRELPSYPIGVAMMTRSALDRGCRTVKFWGNPRE